jgi:hypothetical protein
MGNIGPVEMLVFLAVLLVIATIVFLVLAVNRRK